MNVLVRQGRSREATAVRKELASHVRVRSVVSLTPEHSYSNADIESALGLRSLNRVCSRIGIRERRTFLPLDLRTGRAMGSSENYELDIAQEIGSAAIKDAGIDPGSIAVFMLVSCTIQRGTRLHFELASHELVDRLNLRPTVHRLEIDAGCDGFVHALHYVNSLFNLKYGEHALIVVTSLPSLYFDKERCSRLPHEAQFPNFVFGDGAAAAILSAGESGSGKVVASWSGCDPKQQLGWTTLSPDKGAAPDIAYAINFKTVRESYVPAIIKAVNGLRETYPQLDLSKVDRVFFHQANGVLPLEAARALGIPEEKVAMNAGYRGNTAAATIPTLMSEALCEMSIGQGSTILLAAAGAGLSRSAALLEY